MPLLNSFSSPHGRKLRSCTKLNVTGFENSRLPHTQQQDTLFNIT